MRLHVGAGVRGAMLVRCYKYLPSMVGCMDTGDGVKAGQGNGEGNGWSPGRGSNGGEACVDIDSLQDEVGRYDYGVWA